MELIKFGIQKISLLLVLSIVSLAGTGDSNFIDELNRQLDDLEEKTLTINKKISEINNKSLSDLEVSKLIQSTLNKRILDDRIKLDLLFQLYQNENLSSEGQEVVWEYLLQGLRNAADLGDYQITAYLYKHFLTEDGESLSPTEEIYLDDFWTGLSPQAQELLVKRLSVAHQRAILFDLIRRHGPAKEESINPDSEGD